MQPDEELNPQESNPVGEPAPEYPEMEPVPAEGVELTPEQPSAESVIEETYSEPVTEKPAAGTLPRLQVGQPHPRKTLGSRVLPWVIVAGAVFSTWSRQVMTSMSRVSAPATLRAASASRVIGG